MADSFWTIIMIEVIFTSTYKTPAKNDLEYSRKIILLIVWVRYNYIWASICFDAVIFLIHSDCCFYVQQLLKVYLILQQRWWCPF